MVHRKYEIVPILSELRGHLRRAVAREAGLTYLSALLVTFGFALIAAELGWTRFGLWLLALALVGGAGGWIWVLRRRAGEGDSSALRTARLAEQLAPELGSSPSSAVDLARQIASASADVQFSLSLADAHIAHTSGALTQVGLVDRLVQDRREKNRWILASLAAACLWALILSLVLDDGRSRIATLLLNPNAARISDVPLAGDLRLVYHYPSYTGLSPRTVEGGDGSISAVVGTEVELQATADRVARSALLKIDDMGGKEMQQIPMELSEGRHLAARLSVMQDGRYHFAMVDDEGDRLEERQRHAIRAILDAYPEVSMDQPTEDIELKDDQTVQVFWRAKDDFGVADVNLVVERKGAKEPVRIPLGGPDQVDKRREGRYRWSIAELGLEPGQQARFYIEVLDNDAISGPKRSMSVARQLVLFSARANHEKLLTRQREMLDHMVDWLGAELVAPFPTKPEAQALAGALEAQRLLVERINNVSGELLILINELREDDLSGPEIVAAFQNVLEHIQAARDDRRRLVTRAGRDDARAPHYAALARGQARDVEQLEKDIVYLDDLLAIQRIDELKNTAKDLLSAQRELQDLLQQYRESQDPALRTMLEQRIAELRNKMMELLAKMASIKKQLPGEYRNMESAAMLEVGDQMDRLEKLLKEGDLEAAARELEQLANMLEEMVDSINNAEEQYGGERYAEMRKQLAEFAQEFRELEDQQKALAERTEDMLKSYRKEAIERAGRNLDRFVEKARKKTAEALEHLENLADNPLTQLNRERAKAEQRLKDLDSLLEHKDFFEARQTAEQAEAASENLNDYLQNRARMPHGRPPRPELAQSAKQSGAALDDAREVRKMLDKLFPDPQDVLTPEQMARMQRMAQRQRELERQAGELGQKMDSLAQQMPLFGGEPRGNLDSAQQEMGQAAGQIRGGSLPRAAGHERRAVEQLGKLREALEQASQGGGGKGLPLPLGGSAGRQGQGGRTGYRPEDVEIPQSDPNRAGPRYRQELLEAAKQKPPQRYEDAVQRYYKELIR